LTANKIIYYADNLQIQRAGLWLLQLPFFDDIPLILVLLGILMAIDVFYAAIFLRGKYKSFGKPQIFRPKLGIYPNFLAI
jgi:hypothetical protein